MKSMFKQVSSIICGLLLMAGSAYATDYYVSSAGDGSDGLSWGSAYNSPQEAVLAAADGDSIHVATGVYDVVSQIDLLGKSLTIRGGYFGETPEPGGRTDDPYATVFDGGGVSRILYATNVTDVAVEGLTLRNAYFDRDGGLVYGGAAVYLNKVKAVFRNCVFLNNRVYGYSVKGAAIYSDGGSDTLVVDGCMFLDNTVAGGGGSPSAGAIVQTGGYFTMVDSVMVGSYPGAVSMTGTATGHYAFFTNNLIRCNSGGGAAVASYRKSTVVANCTIADNNSPGLSRGSGTFVITNSIVWRNQDDIVGTVTLSHSCVGDLDSGTAVIHDDPQFTEDYYLLGTSPCIDNGGGTALEAGLNGYYSELAASDTGTVDLGYHHSGAYAPAPANLYVDAVGGVDTNTGTAPAQALRTITRALALASTGTRIHIAAGVYDTELGETFPLAVNFLHIYLIGAGAQTTIVDASGSGARVAEFYNLGSGSAISGLTFRGGVSAISGAGLNIERTAARFSDLVIHGCQLTTGGGKGGGINIDSGWPEFSDCVITNNKHASNIGSTTGGGVSVAGSGIFNRCIIADNRVSYNGHSGGLSFGGFSLDINNSLIAFNEAHNANTTDGIQIGQGTIRMLNTTVAGNLGIGVNRTGGTIWATNSIFWANGVDCKGASVNLAYSCISNSVDYIDGGYNITTEMLPFPLFVDEAAGDYRLADDSPLIDAGFYEPWMRGTTDLADMPRVMANTVDIGAYEWASPQLTLLFVR